MKPQKLSLAGRAVWYVLAMILLILSVLAFLPEIETDTWWVRYAEFPRLQFLIATLGGLALFVVVGGLGSWAGRVLVAAAAVASAVQAFHLSPLTPLVAEEVPSASSCTPERSLRVLSVNVQAGNRDSEALMDAVRSSRPDVVLLLETDAWWDERIADLYGEYPHHVRSQPRAAHYYGMQLLSRFPLESPEMLYLFDEATPTVDARIALPDGQRIRFLGLHPRPPLSEPQPTTLRDGSIAAMAKRAAESSEPTIMSGDFNAVSWSPIVELAKRVGQFKDPRVGRGFIASFDAKSSWMRWPLDHILVQDGASVMSFGRLGAIGSDHYPMIATLCMKDAATGRHERDISRDDLAAVEQAVEAARNLR